MGPVQDERDLIGDERGARQAARLVLTAFVLTFLISRITVLLIMLRVIPDLYVHVGQTHVHHLNFGIFILAGTGAYLLFARPGGRRHTGTAVFYGIGLALTFDEFGLWLHLGGTYWQRASFDAVVVITSLLALLAFAPSLKHLRPRQWAMAVVLFAALAAFAILMSRMYAGRLMGLKLRAIENAAPP